MANNLKKWIRLPEKGGNRLQGVWHEVVGDLMLADYNKNKVTGYLPTARQIAVAEIVKDPRGLVPNYIVRGGEMVHQFHEIAVPLGAGTPDALQRAQMQLMNLLQTVLVIEGETHD